MRARPSSGAIAAGADPPLFLLSTVAATAHVTVRLPWLHHRQVRGQVSLRTLLRNSREQCANLCLPIPTVPAERTNGSQLPGFGPPCDGLRVNPEHGRDLCWGQQRLGLWRACRHVDGLSSWTGTAILRFIAVPGSIGEPAVDVLYGLLRPYCHHQR